MKTLTILKYLFAVLGVGMLIGAGVSVVHTRAFLAHATRTQGTVVALQPRHSKMTSTNTHDSVTFVPLVRFSHAGQVSDFTGTTSSNPPRYHIGETVPVLYVETDPFGARIDSFFSVWGAAMILGILGAVFLLIGGGMIIVPRMRGRGGERAG